MLPRRCQNAMGTCNSGPKLEITSCQVMLELGFKRRRFCQMEKAERKLKAKKMMLVSVSINLGV